MDAAAGPVAAESVAAESGLFLVGIPVPPHSAGSDRSGSDPFRVQGFRRPQKAGFLPVVAGAELRESPTGAATGRAVAGAVLTGRAMPVIWQG